MFGAAMHYYLSENYFLSGERHHGCRSSEDGYVKRIQELGERKEKVLLNIKEIRRTLSQLNDEIKGMSDLSTTTTCNTKAQDGISSSTVLPEEVLYMYIMMILLVKAAAMIGIISCSLFFKLYDGYLGTAAVHT
mmetsp:Transcript_17672/g.28785  ORF Transcript_17672/g.28785 Transcript_17672/m.28785 type:complete len:134 (+) Transcript_17672:336-737(+)